MFCENCGKQMPDGAKFCTECGAELKQPAPAPAASSAPVNAASSGAAKPKKKNTAVIVICIVLGVLILMAAGLFFAIRFFGRMAREAYSEIVETQEELIDDFSDEAEDVIDEAEDLVDEAEDHAEDFDDEWEGIFDNENDSSSNELSRSELDGIIDEYIGSWEDSWSQRAHMEIARASDPDKVYIDVYWGNSFDSTTHWSFTATYDAGEDCLSYEHGKCYDETDNGDKKIYTDGRGQFYFDRDGNLRWDDYTENAGDKCVFELVGDPGDTDDGSGELDNTDDMPYVLPDSDSRYIDESELDNLTEWGCKVARNEIYARYGRKFKDKDLQNYFDSKAWYSPSVDAKDFDESILNKWEKANVLTITQYEKKMGYR
ncbi:MAG: YARHG domain-containing protein [Lachnospiraceae bacterium]|nr:YARHG domain-containing protein [Lachnospiraceae bacterium]